MCILLKAIIFHSLHVCQEVNTVLLLAGLKNHFTDSFNDWSVQQTQTSSSCTVRARNQGVFELTFVAMVMKDRAGRCGQWKE